MAISVETLTLFKEVLAKLRDVGEPGVPMSIMIKIVEVREKGAK
jgi:hypothetical protein